MSRIAIAIGSAAVLLLANTVSADSPKDAVQYRQSVMESLAGHMGAIGKLTKHEVSYNHLMDQAKALADTAPTVSDIFPANSKPSDDPKTHALAKIWQQPEDFHKKVMAFQMAAKAFLADVESGDQSKVMGGVKQLGMSCGGCHREYRKKMQRH